MLKNVKKFESVGFSPTRQMASGHEQAEVLAESLEDAQVSGQESLKDFIRNELVMLRYDLLLKIFAIVTGTAGLLFAMIKLFT